MFVGRESELKKLNQMYAGQNFEFAVFYGRRRVGKTTLINEFCKNKKAIYYVGLETSFSENLQEFSKAIWQVLHPGTVLPPFQDFESAFDFIADSAKQERLILVIDEYPYLAESYSGISSLLQSYIDRKFKQSQLFLILCGSSMSFMEHQVLGYKSPLYGRRTAQFKIEPFDFFDSSKMLSDFPRNDQALLYGVTGGVPEYLSYIDPSVAADENIKRLFFDSTGRLFEEPSNLLKQELRNPSTYNAVMAAIATGASRLNQIAEKSRLASSSCSSYLRSLIELGIIKKEYPVTENEGRKTIYRFQDEMFRFSYRFVRPNTSMIAREMGSRLYDMEVKPQLSDFMGEVFERICYDYLIREQQCGRTPFFFTKIGRWWGGNPQTHQQEEIDILAYSNQQAIFGECKWREEPVRMSVLDTLLRCRNLFHFSDAYLYIFSKTSFSEELESKAGADDHIRLIAFEDMVSERF